MLHRLRLTSSIGTVIALGLAIVVLLSGCGGAAKANAAPLTQRAPAQTPSATPTAVGVAPLLPQPLGPATLTWDPANGNTLTVNLSVTGLAPASPGSYASTSYPAEIGSGSCQKPGNVVHKLNSVTADQYGAANSTTTIKGVAGGIPARDWHIALRAPAAANQQGTLLACAPVINPNPSTTQKQSVKTMLRGMALRGGEAAAGAAKLTLNGTTLTVTVALAGMAPGSKHDAHIHSGSCSKQGPIVHPLKTITADANGRANVETTIQGVKSIPADWYINIHAGTDLNSQEGFQPIACGNVLAHS
jgi:hypothetical protein